MATQDFLASVPFRTAKRLPLDGLTTRPVVEGLTVGGRPYSIMAVMEQPYPWLLLVVSPAPGRDEATVFLRVPIAHLVGQLVESVLAARLISLDAELAAALDTTRGALSGMTFTSPRGDLNGMDLFGEVLAHIGEYGHHWGAWEGRRESLEWVDELAMIAATGCDRYVTNSHTVEQVEQANDELERRGVALRVMRVPKSDNIEASGDVHVG